MGFGSVAMQIPAMARSTQAPVGRRERNKRDKMLRIEHAARRLFSQQGFEATTIRQIAAAADIGLGTVFSYTANKNDLLVRIFQDEVGRAVERAFATAPDKPLLDRILHVLGAIIAHHRENPGLARIFVKETPFIDDRRHGLAAFMRDLLGGLAEFVEEAKRHGELAADVPARALVRNLFGIFFQHMQIWLRSDARELDARQLRDALALQLRGLRVTPHRAPASKRRPRARHK
jgi:AcrR family transcriptional regulator